ncbi:hypothetical protein [Clostridium ganghwense]|uniref:Com family DNA-binding transcriptional regulator n=1 Tax=Clostridium ganghwense TaxID=312089 RepID=A0ABT4CTL8_9CLOT|nr:hypothetical protein [Clostridium ganghwense]MCY6372420.1 hypothetical protein [Clostridium ganghwense]
MAEDKNQFRCPQCNKLLFMYEVKGSLKIEIKCNRCRRVSTLIVKGGEHQ